jgi:hypothetical protein
MGDLLKSPQGDQSSKRVAGFVLLAVLCGLSVYISVKHPEHVPDVLKALTWGIGVCFGATAMEKIRIPGAGA